jgi:hypothetical protein
MNAPDQSEDQLAPTATSHQRTFEIRPRRREGGSSVAALVVSFSIIALEMLVVIAVAVFVAFVRVIAAIWILFTLALGIYGIPRFRRVQRGLADNTALWLSDTRLGYTNWQGVDTTCNRFDVQSAWRLLTTIGGQPRDVLVFIGHDGRALIYTPLQTWRLEEIDALTAALGIGVAHRKFVNTEAELEQVAPGLPNFGAANRRRRLIAYGFATLLTVVVLIVLLLAARH